MDVVTLTIALLTTVACSLVIMVACDSFEDASGFLGKEVYKMPAGVRGATIDAIASSMPELFTASFLLFYYMDEDGFSAGIATCAGSAVFNAVVIPAVCILAVMIKGVKENGVLTKLSSIQLQRSTILRDGFFFLAAEFTLIYFLGSSTLVWWMGAVLMGVYAVYFSYLMIQTKLAGGDDEDEEGAQEAAEDESAEEEEPDLFGMLIRLDYNGLLFGGKDFSAGRAWVVLLMATATIGLACHFLAGAVMDSAKALGVAPYFTAVILAAAATSVPDTVISVNSATSGDYDDAVSNAVGSNIFDICVALGLPLLVYGLMYGDVSLAAAGSAADVQELRWALVVVTFIALGLFLLNLPSKQNKPGIVRMGKGKAYLMFGIYIAWTAFIVVRAMDLPWARNLLG